MLIRILRDTVCGQKRVKAGAMVEASDADARTLILMGKAEPAAAIQPKADTTPPAADESTRAIGLNTESGAAVIKRDKGKRK